jgi:hypothetical protein
LYTLAPEITDRIAAVEMHLASLDPILHDFCTRRSYRFGSHVGVWPTRNVHQRHELDELDRCLCLMTDLTVEELMKRGFSPNMPWSLEVAASSYGRAERPARLLSARVFSGLPFSLLQTRLAADLESGFETLQTFTWSALKERGSIFPFPPAVSA